MENQVKEIFISTTDSLKIVKAKGLMSFSLPTIINWAQTYGIGKKVGGRWRIDKKKLIDMLEKGNPNGKTT